MLDRSQTADRVSRVELDRVENLPFWILKLRGVEPPDPTMLFSGKRRVIAGGTRVVDHADVAMLTGNVMNVQVDWRHQPFRPGKFPRRPLTTELDLETALLGHFP